MKHAIDRGEEPSGIFRKNLHPKLAVATGSFFTDVHGCLTSRTFDDHLEHTSRSLQPVPVIVAENHPGTREAGSSARRCIDAQKQP